MQKWEYLVIGQEIYPYKPSVEQQTKYLNQFGIDGWELVSVAESNYYFKRPIQ